MKNFFTILFVFFLVSAKANTYYFSSVSGDDSRTSAQARSPFTPWKTLQKLSSVFSSFQPGDFVLLKRGETFYGSIIVHKSGTAALPIVIGAYGTGNKPVITSLVTLTGWVSKGNGIWESNNSSLDKTVNTVLLNNAPQEMGRYPNSDAANKGYLTLESHTRYTITDNELTSSPNWTGAEMVLRARRWVLDRCKITNHSGTKITYNRASNYSANDNYGYFIQNSIKTLDKFGEWYYNPSLKKLSVYFGANNPSSYVTQATSTDNLINSSNYSNIVFDNLTVEGANADGFSISHGSGINITNCDVMFSGGNGMTVKYHNNLRVENCTVTNSNNNGINLGYSGDNAVIKNNKVTNTSVFAGMGGSGDGKGFGIQSCGNGGIIEHNEIINTGYVAINFNGDYTVVKNNFIDGFCLTKDDGSGVYTFTGSANTNSKGRKIVGNIIINGIGAPEGINQNVRLAQGIYLDDNASGVEISGNTVANIPCNGVFLHNARNVSIKNNTLFNNKLQVYMAHDTKGDAVRNCIVTHNIFFLKSAAQKAISITSIADDRSQTGRIDSNYYARPSDSQNASYLKKVHEYESKATVNNYSNPLRFEFNSLLTSKTVFLNKNYTDIKNNNYANNIVLLPFASGVLIEGSGSVTSASPTVSITSPSVNANYDASSNISISADAADTDGSISKVEFYNGSVLLRTEHTQPYIFTWQNVAAGNYTLTAKATDNDGNVTVSSGVAVSVTAPSSANGGPSVSITSPSVNANYDASSNISISADASDTDGTISKVEFYNGSVLLHTEHIQPYIFTWQNVAAGNYTLTAKATDNDGNVTVSSGVAVSVTAPSSANAGPSVEITSPSVNANYDASSNISISADAADTDGTISKVEFYNGSVLLHTQYSQPYSFVWQNVAAGSYTLTAKATDNNGNVTVSSGVAVSVAAPASNSYGVSLTSPAQSATYSSGATVNITATATVRTGWINKVAFYNGTTSIHTETGKPYSWNWKNVKAGNYTITAKATDNNGNVTTSESVTISVHSNTANRSVANNNVSGTNNSAITNTADTLKLKKQMLANTGSKIYSVRLFPNPAVDKIQIDIKDLQVSNQKANLTIRGLSGIVFKTIPVILSGKTIEADVSSLRTGMYIVSIVTDSFTISSKLIKN